ncbi:hypothetical protein FACS1894172_13800 [Spirochaetia bacterium]|nr:hypothetical protein FACS1894164_11920 [Spirochaetia bacterium]GHU34061.1 hypothetical protein FACS1894172_13800 [Spirochaetia bacterium]
MKTKWFRILSALLVLVVAAAAGTYIILVEGNKPTSAEHPHFFEVRRGQSARSVGDNLFEAGVIRNRYVWYILCRVNPETIKAGSYQIPPFLTQREIHQLLTKGQQFKITIPEGSTLKKVARILSEAGICEEDSFLTATTDPNILSQYHIIGPTVEGFLYPDTYFFPAPFPPDLVITVMLDTFINRLQDIQSEEYSPAEIYQKVIIASIVERECRVPEEAPLIAGVLYNRLNINMRLQVDATIEYIITEIQGLPHPERITYANLRIDNPYNTYQHTGLPPGPIGAPGAVALNAAFYPENHIYLFYRLLDPSSGRHQFSRNFDEHRTTRN